MSANSNVPAKDSVYRIQKMDCPTEERLIRNKLEPMSGIHELRFNLMQRELTVRHELEDDQPIVAALETLGMEPERKEGADCKSCEHDHENGKDATVSRMAKWLVAISGVAAFAAEISGWMGAEEGSLQVIALSILAILTGGMQTAKKGWIALKTFTMNINFLMVIAVTGAMIIGEWPEAAMVAFLFAVAEMIEAYSLDRARNAIRDLMEMAPEMALVQQPDGSWQEVAASEVPLNATIKVKPGERIPLDGKIIEGQSTINQAPITGESMPVEKNPGDAVFAGTLNERGSFIFTVTANQGNTTLARIIRSVQEAQSERAPTQRFVDQFARYYTPVIVLLAALIATVPPLFFGAEFMPWLYRALVTLVIACPCALVISTPVTVVSGLAAAARRGILIKGGVYLEEGRKLKALALDKTGTLTHGKPVLTDIRTISTLTAEKALEIAASLNALSEHPVAHAIVTKAALSRPLTVSNFEAMTGRGVNGVIDGTRYYLGNHRLAEELGVCGEHVESELLPLESEGKTAVVLATEQQALCVFAVADTVRTTSVEAVKSLQQLGVHCVMLTGDNSTTAQAIATHVGIEDVRGNMLPEDKLKAMEELRKNYDVVGMVGDGVNDAPALARASIGFAMGAAGTDTALETADVALMEDDLRRIPLFMNLSRKTSTILKQNISLSIGIKAVFLALNFAGLATLWMAVFADMGASLIVVFNGLRLLKFQQQVKS
ncbi:MAG: cadmium-translocating P-type ATPase [Azospirillum brasilense]|jgi:Cd2+/Zn2+-exporting ATPase|nr:MAG: cadmium-translocating P-type ATPase [Azospirillum brasilense]